MTTEPEAPASSLSIEEAAQLVADWIEPARSAFAAGQPVHLTFSPGDDTAYAMSFVPAGQALLCTEREYPRVNPSQALLVLPIAGKSIIITPDGSPYPSFVAEKAKTENPPMILAVGLCWWLMVGDGSTERTEEATRIYGEWLERIGSKGLGSLPCWKRELIEGGAYLPPSGPPLLRADLMMALSNYEAKAPTLEQMDPYAERLVEAVRAVLAPEISSTVLGWIEAGESKPAEEITVEPRRIADRPQA